MNEAGIFANHPGMTISVWRRKLRGENESEIHNGTSPWLLHRMQLTDRGREVFFGNPRGGGTNPLSL